MSDPALSDPDDLGGQLRVTPAGTVVVSTDALLASADRLRSLEAALHGDVRRVIIADSVATGMPIDGIVPALERLRARCEGARDAFGRIAEDYTRTEAAIERAQRDLAAMIAAAVGPAVFGALMRLILFCPGALIAGALLGWAAIPDGPDGRLGTVRDFMIAHPELITSPEFVRFVSLVATSIDDAVLGGIGVPSWLVALPGLDLSPDGGVAAGALTVAAMGAMLGMFRETPVSVDRVSTQALNVAPAGVRERLDNIPEGDQIRIEKYEAEGMPPRYTVSVGPTETFSPYADQEPFDSTSNTYGVAGLSAGSFRAVELAMAEAGIRPGDEVVLTGFSQGGLVATMVAASGDWNVVGLETHGAPAGNIPLPSGIAGMAIRNTDDLVPALAGPQFEHDLMQVERRAFREGVDIPTVQAAPAHQRTGYEGTASAIDRAESSAVQQQIRTLDAFAADYLERPGGHATVMMYHATRD
ncbi:hypothetical protein [Pseudolysinimonas yzui]|uniref:Uncharacterized protein n=1 Tax=Pseudolysinimonas yzui TaxID=2708254 RepID=A0A8J3GS12_9MICO|nr:hypothetical protein [Pseudolysinimonas yzui]GHF21583.1 hypothetical protein GCM10011600_23170 [Pseudolysinimonas yzui]